MEYTIESFKKGKFVIFCEKEEYAEHLVTLLGKGIETRWNHYENYTCCYYPRNNLAYRHLSKCITDGLHIIEYNEFIKKIELNEKSNKEKILEIIGVKLGEPFNIVRSDYNPYAFDGNYDLIDGEGDLSNYEVFNILWGMEKVEKIIEDPNKEVKKHIELISGKYFGRNNTQEAVLFLLNENLAQKESKSVS